MTATTWRPVWMLLILVESSALAAPAGAQFAGGRSAFDQRSGAERVQFRDFFGGDRRSSYPNNSYEPFWGNRRPSYPNNSYDPYNPFYRRPQVYESTKAPPPRKVDKPPAETVVVIGDLLGDWLGYGLEQVFAETPEIGIERKIKPDLGLARDDARVDAPEWSKTISDLLTTEKPNAIVLMLGINDRLPLRDRVPTTRATTALPDSDHPASAAVEVRPQGANYEFHTDRWAELYSKRIDDMIATLKTKGVPIVWVGLPAIRGAKSTSDMSYLNELYRARAENAIIAPNRKSRKRNRRWRSAAAARPERVVLLTELHRRAPNWKSRKRNRRRRRRRPHHRIVRPAAAAPARPIEQVEQIRWHRAAQPRARA